MHSSKITKQLKDHNVIIGNPPKKWKNKITN